MGKFEKALYRAQDGKCFVCDQPMEKLRGKGVLPSTITREHVTPKARQGALGYPNLALSHKTCNRAKDDEPPTPGQLVRLEEINRRLDRQDVIVAVAEQIEVLKYGGARTPALEFLSSALPELTPAEIVTAFRLANISQPLPAAGVAAPPREIATAAPARARDERRFPPDPLDLPNLGGADYEGAYRPRGLLALAGILALAAAVTAMLGLFGVAPDWGAGLVRPIILAPALGLGAVLAILYSIWRGRLYSAAALFLLAAIASGLAATPLDLQALDVFNNLMSGNDLPFRLAGQSALTLGGLALAALASLSVVFAALTARAPADR